MCYSENGGIDVFSENLRNLRKKAGLSQREFAEKIGMSTSAVGMYEQGRREPEPQMLLKIAKVLQVTVEQLLEEEPTVELGEMVEAVLQNMMARENLTMDGRTLSEEELRTVSDAIRMGVRFAQKSITEKKNG